jgi:pimeloyl-ACP methyl ester carboxylesterase
MPELHKITTAPGLTFDAFVDGPPAGDVVLLLHGFPESRHSWREALPPLGAAGYRALAPDQRGYSPGARPDPRDLDNYAYEKLIGDAIAIADAAGARGKRFHLVGHDWGGQVSWGVAEKHPERLASLTILSRPHPSSFRRAFQTDPEQPHRSRHHKAFLDPNAGPQVLERLKQGLFGQDSNSPSMQGHLSVLGSLEAIEAALAWYRGRGLGVELAPTKVPTLYLWGDADATVGEIAAKGTRDFVAAEFAMEVLPGVGHFIMDQAAAKATDLILAHLRKHPV